MSDEINELLGITDPPSIPMQIALDENRQLRDRVRRLESAAKEWFTELDHIGHSEVFDILSRKAIGALERLQAVLDEGS